MPQETEIVHHPLVADVAESSEKVLMNYTMDGVAEVQTMVFNDPSVSNSKAYFTFRPPLGSLIDRQILLELTVEVTTTAADAANPAFGDYFAPKCLPANRALEMCNVSINGHTITSEPGRICSVMSRNKMNQESIKKFRSMSPSEPDSMNRYENYALKKSYDAVRTGSGDTVVIPDFTGAASTLTNYTTDSPYSPFKIASYNMGDDYESRASFPYTETSSASGGLTTVKRSYTFTEVLLNPFCMQRENSAASHVTSLDISLSFAPNLERIFSNIRAISQRNYTGTTMAATLNGFGGLPAGGQIDHKNGFDVSSQTITISKAQVYVKVATPSIPIAPSQTIQLNQFFLKQQFLGKVTSDYTIDFNPVRLAVVPSHIFIFAKQKISDEDRFHADAFLNISKLSLQISNRSGLLSNLPEQELYMKSVENGINLSWPQYHQRVGSIICLGFGKDIPGLLPGVKESIDFGFRCTLNNTTYFDHSGKTAPLTNATTDQSINWELYALIVTPMTMHIRDNEVTTDLGISYDEYLDAVQYGPSSESLEDLNLVVGAGFGDWLRKGYHKAHHLVKKYARPIEQVLRRAEDIPVLGNYIGKAADVADIAAKAVGTGGMKNRLQYVRGEGRMY